VLAGLPGLIALSGCSSSTSKTGPPGVRITVSPLSVPGLSGACYDLEVSNGTGVVWSKGDSTRTFLGASQALDNGPLDANDQGPDSATICSGVYGNGRGGDITFVGTCDATTDSDLDPLNGVQNRVTVWIDGLYNEGGSADVGAWRDPCPAEGCQLQVTCAENTDSLAEFNFTIMRGAQQGFFDIAVDFQDVFCSAKFDTCYLNDVGADDDERIELLFGAGGGRDWTGVFGFACTAGVDTPTRDVRTNLLYGAITVRCGENTFRIDPTVPAGNASTVGTQGETLHYGVYRGTEQLKCSGERCNKLYWNLAVSLDDLASLGGGCSLAFEATVNDNNDGFEGGLPTGSGLAYPYVVVATDLTVNGAASCQANPLNSGPEVRTEYRGTLAGLTPPVAMCHQYDGDAATSTGAAVGCSAFITNVAFSTSGALSQGSSTDGLTNLGFSSVAPLTNGTTTLSNQRFE